MTPATSRQAQKAETRASILAAARALFAERGFEATTLKAVAEAAGVAVGTVFVHVPDKAALLTEALHDDLERVLSAARMTLPEAPRDQILHLAGALYGYYAQNPALSGVLVKESLLAPLPEGSNSDAVLRGFLASVAGALMAGGMLRPGTSPITGATAFFALYLVVLLGGLRGADAGGMDPDAMIAQLSGLMDVAFPQGSGLVDSGPLGPIEAQHG